MDEIEMTRLMMELMRLLQDTSMFEGKEEGDLDERVERIKRELGSWFIDDYQLYLAS